jgi:large subunit ribosomal protein L10
VVRSDKVDLVNELTGTFKSSQSVILSDFKGMTVEEMTTLRTKLREQAVPMRVLKNRLVRRALVEAGADALDEFLVGNTAVSFGMADPVAPAKILVEYAKSNEKLIIKGGLLEGKFLDENGVRNLAKMPGRKELLSIMAGDLKQPATKMAMVFQAGLLKVAYAMNALAAKKEETGAAA